MSSWTSSALLAVPIVLALPALLLTEAFITTIAVGKRTTCSPPFDDDSNKATQQQRQQRRRRPQQPQQERVTMSAQDTFESYQGGDYTVFVGRCAVCPEAVFALLFHTAHLVPNLQVHHTHAPTVQSSVLCTVLSSSVCYIMDLHRPSKYFQVLSC